MGLLLRDSLYDETTPNSHKNYSMHNLYSDVIYIYIYECYNVYTSTGSAIAIDGGNFGFGLGSIHLSGLTCVGNETALSKCPITQTFFSLFCSHSLDVGVLCPREYIFIFFFSSLFIYS